MGSTPTASVLLRVVAATWLVMACPTPAAIVIAITIAVVLLVLVLMLAVMVRKVVSSVVVVALPTHTAVFPG